MVVYMQVWAGWVYREGARAGDRANQINYWDCKCQPGKALNFSVSTS